MYGFARLCLAPVVVRTTTLVVRALYLGYKLATILFNFDHGKGSAHRPRRIRFVRKARRGGHASAQRADNRLQIVQVVTGKEATMTATNGGQISR
jgi:hypothetical protein